MSIIREKIYLSDLEIEVIRNSLDILYISNDHTYEHPEKMVEIAKAVTVKIIRELTRRREQEGYWK